MSIYNSTVSELQNFVTHAQPLLLILMAVNLHVLYNTHIIQNFGFRKFGHK